MRHRRLTRLPKTIKDAYICARPESKQSILYNMAVALTGLIIMTFFRGNLWANLLAYPLGLTGYLLYRRAQKALKANAADRDTVIAAFETGDTRHLPPHLQEEVAILRAYHHP